MTLTLPPAGSIGLVKANGLEGKAIETAEWLADKIDHKTFDNYEHAFVLMDDRPGFPDPLAVAQVVEAEPGGVRMSFLNEYHGREVLWIPCPPQYSAAMQFAAVSYLRVPYSFADYPVIAAHDLGIDPLHFGQDVVDHTGHVICSMLAIACAQKAGWPLVPADQWAGYFTPDDVARLAPAGSQPQLIA